MNGKNIKVLSPLSGVVLALFLAGCGSNPGVLAYLSYDPAYAPGEEGGLGPVQVTVQGTPFTNISQADAIAPVIAAMQGTGFAPTRFQATDNPHSSYTAALLFGPAARYADSRVCEIVPENLPPVTDTRMPSAGSDVPVVAALCRGNTRLSGTFGHIPASSSVDDPVFKNSIAQLVRALIPARNPNADGNGDFSS